MKKHNKIILITIDTLSSDHLGCYGYNIPKTPTTPFLDALAEEGVLFQKHYATDVPTPPSFASLLYGTRGIKNGIIGFNNKSSEFRSTAPSLAQCFQKNGFRTGMISNLLYLEIGKWLVQGFQDIYPPGLRFQGGTAEEVTDESLRWLGMHGKKDLFLFVHYWDPHVPYLRRSRAKYRKMFSPGEYKNSVPDMKYFRKNKLLKVIYDEKHKFINDPLEPEKNLALYDANIRYVDDNIRRLCDGLKKMGIYEKTLFVITSDHGEAFGEYGFYDHWSCYRNISQIPLIFGGRGIKALKVSTYTQNIDVMPTILELAGLKIPRGLCGKTMVPVLTGKQKDFRDEIVTDSDASVIQRMYVKDDYALVHTPSRPVWKHIKEYELFNLAKDPDQVKDISSKEKERCNKMKLLLSDWLTEQLRGKPDVLQLCLMRGGWMWKSLLRLLDPSDAEKLRREHPNLAHIR